MHGTRGRTAVLVAAMAAVGLSCGREITGPAGVGGRRSASVAIVPRLPAAVGTPGGASLVEYQSVRLIFRRSGGAVALDRTYAFPSTADSLALSVQVPLGPDANAEGEAFTVLLKFLTSAGAVVFAGGPVSVFAAGGAQAPQAVEIPVTYVGPGASATRIVIAGQAAIRLTGTQSVPLTTQAFDAQNQPVTDAPVSFTSTDTAVAQVSPTGVITGRNARGSALVIARLLSGAADTVSVTAQPNAVTIAAVGGNAQTGAAGAALPTPVAVRVTAADGLGVSGVSVTFAAGAGGSVSSASVITNTTGDASVTWTLGDAGGTQTLTATATGLSGSPVTFSATATAAPATQLAFTVQPVTYTAGVNFTPAVQVTARTATGAIATGYNGPITIALGSNPANGTLEGTTTVTAVNGVASFGSVSIARAGLYNLVASASGLSAATSVGFTVLAGPAAALAWAQQPLNGSVGSVLSPSPRVRAVDAFGNVATGASGNVTLALSTNPTGAALQGTTTAQFVQGEATFSNVSVSLAGSGYRLQASSTGLVVATSDLFSIGGGAIIEWVNANGGLWSNAANWSLARVPASGDTVLINATGTYTVTMDVSPSVARVDVGGASGTPTLALSSRTLTVSGGVSIGTFGALRIESASIGGAGSIQNDGVLELLLTNTLPLPIANTGILTVSGSSTLNGALTMEAGALLVIAQRDALAPTASLTVANGFTNNGTIQLSNGVTSGTNAQLQVTAGTLINAAGASIEALTGQSLGGARTLAAQLDNRGTVSLFVPLTLAKSGADHLNSGTIDASVANLTVTQSGTTPTLTNTGSIIVGTGQTMTLTGGTFNQAGTFTGGGTLAIASAATLTLTRGLSTTDIKLRATSSTIAGPDTLTNAAGQTMQLLGTTVTVPVVNAGVLVASGNTALNGTLTTAPGSVLRVSQLDACCGTARLSILTGFTNLGSIELSNGAAANYAAELVVSQGDLVNAPGAFIKALPGQTAGGSRSLVGRLNNQGTIQPSVPMSITSTVDSIVNTGSIDVTVADVTTSTASGTFINRGTITIGTGRKLRQVSGAFSQEGVVTGTGTLEISFATLRLKVGFSTAQTALSVINGNIDGPDTLTNAAGRTTTMVNGNVLAPFVNAGTLVASGTTSLNGGVTTTVGSTIRVAQVDAATATATLDVANGFTNLGTIELSSAFTAAAGARLLVRNSALVNAQGASIVALGGQTPGGTRTLTAVVDNQGSIVADVPLTMTPPVGSVGTSINTGTVHASGGSITVTQATAFQSFNHTGGIQIDSGRTFTVSGGTFSTSLESFISGATLALAGTTASLNGILEVTDVSMTGTTVTISDINTTNGTNVTLSGSTVNGAGALEISPGDTVVLIGSTVNIPIANAGVLTAGGLSSITGALTQGIGGKVRVGQLDSGAGGVARLTVANGFTNLGIIELTNLLGGAGYAAELAITSGTLVNAAGGTLVTLPGVLGGGARVIAGTVNNQGLLSIAPSGAGSLTVTQNLASTGTIALELGGTTASTGFDRIEVLGAASLGGTLTVGLINSFAPASGNSFAILSATGGVSGTFSTATLPAGIAQPPTYGATAVTLVAP